MTNIVGVVPSHSAVSFVDSAHVNRNAKRIEQDEAELEALIKQHMNPQGDEEVEEEEVETPPVKKSVEKKEADVEPEEDSEELSAEEKSYKKRYGDLRRHMAKLQEENKALKDAPAKVESVVPPKSEEEVVAWMKKYPDVAAIVEAIAEKKATEKFSGAQERLSQLDSLAEEATRSKAEAEIRAFHPDFDELREQDAFHNWADEQPKWIRDALYENSDDAVSVVKVINLYKMEKGIDTKGRKEADKKAVTNVVTRRSKPEFDAEGTGKAFKESQVNHMSVHEYEKNQDKIMEAIRTGQFIYDVSGAAR